MKSNPPLLLLGALSVFALFCVSAPAAADEEADLWASLSDEGVSSLDQFVPGAPSPDFDDEMLRAPETPDEAVAPMATAGASAPVTTGSNDERPGDPANWRGKGSYRNHYFDSRPAPPAAGEALEPGAWPTRGAAPSEEESEFNYYAADQYDYYPGDQYDYYPDDGVDPGSIYGRRALPNSHYGYGRAPAGASRGYGGPARPGGGYGPYADDPDEDWEPDDGD